METKQGAYLNVVPIDQVADALVNFQVPFGGK